jgi:hypothetical protein
MPNASEVLVYINEDGAASTPRRRKVRRSAKHRKRWQIQYPN